MRTRCRALAVVWVVLCASTMAQRTLGDECTQTDTCTDSISQEPPMRCAGDCDSGQPDCRCVLGGMPTGPLYCYCKGIPTLSEWVAIGMTLLLLVAGTIVFFRKRGREAGVA